VAAVAALLGALAWAGAAGARALAPRLLAAQSGGGTGLE
jgi:hypothetical protein